MGYLHINNLYKDQDILLFRECYALEKVHGTSAHISISPVRLHFFSGGESHERFVKLFDSEKIQRTYTENFTDEVTLFGEAHGGKCQGMSKTYGPDLRFVVFDVKVGECWLSVPQAEDVAGKFELAFVPWERIPTNMEAIDAERDKPSALSRQYREACPSILPDQVREGIVLRPLIEVRKNNGDRIIAKHKRVEFAERASIPNIDPAKRELMERAGEIVDEWVVPMRLNHVLDKLRGDLTIQRIPDVIAAMVEDVTREAAGEISDNQAVRKAIGQKTVVLYKHWLNQQIKG